MVVNLIVVSLIFNQFLSSFKYFHLSDEANQIDHVDQPGRVQKRDEPIRIRVNKLPWLFTYVQKCT